MASGGCSKKPVKIVIISTQYVETDAMSFKSVVQKLTGKHSSDDHHANREAPKAKRQRHNLGGVVDVPCASGHGSSFLIRDSLLKEYDNDMWLAEMPPLDYNFWSD